MTLLHAISRPSAIIGVEVAGTTVQPSDLTRTAHRRRLGCPTPEESLVVRDRRGLGSVVWLRYGDVEKAQQAHQGISQIILNGERLRPAYSRRSILPRMDMLGRGASASKATQQGDTTTRPAGDDTTTGTAVSIDGLPARSHPKVLSSFLRGYDLVEDQTDQLHEIYGNGDRSCWLVRLKTPTEAQRLARDANHSYHRMRRDNVGDYVLRAQVFH